MDNLTGIPNWTKENSIKTEVIAKAEASKNVKFPEINLLLTLIDDFKLFYESAPDKRIGDILVDLGLAKQKITAYITDNKSVGTIDNLSNN